MGKRRLLAFYALLLALCGAAAVRPLAASGEAEIPAVRYVALTFDDGPSRNTQDILKVLLTEEEIKARVEELGLVVNPYVFEEMPQLLHGPTAAAALAREFPGLPRDVVQAIARRTAGSVGMTDGDEVGYVAAAHQPGRDYAGLDEIRALALCGSLCGSFARVLPICGNVNLDECVRAELDSLVVLSNDIVAELGVGLGSGLLHVADRLVDRKDVRKSEECGLKDGVLYLHVADVVLCDRGSVDDVDVFHVV